MKRLYVSETSNKEKSFCKELTAEIEDTAAD